MSHNLTHRCHNSILPYLAYSSVVIPYYSSHPVPNGKKRGRRERPPQKVGGHVTPIAVLSHIPLSGPMRVALVLIYPCGKARSSPPEGVLTEGRQTYERAQPDLFFEGALAPARWPHELEKPNPCFGRGGLVGVSEFGVLRVPLWDG